MSTQISFVTGMHRAILIAAILWLSPPVINAEKGKKDDNWVDPFYIDSSTNTGVKDWMDPLDLEGHSNLLKTLIKYSTENGIEELSEESKTEKLVETVESTGKSTQTNEEIKDSSKMFEKNVRGSTETEMKTSFAGNLEKEETCHGAKYEMAHNFLLRFINMLVNICVSKSTEMQKKISVTLEISPEELKQLQRLKDNKDVAPAIRLLNTIISDMKFNDHEEDQSSFFHPIKRLFSSKEVWVEIGVISFAILPTFLFILGGRMTKIISISLLMTFSVSYYGTYRFLLQKAKEKNERILSGTSTCTPDERAWYHSIFGSNSDSECQKRWDALHIDPSIGVTPVNVISHMVGVVIFQPLEQFGAMFSSFSSQIFESQPLLRGIIVYSTAVLIIIIMSCLCCYGIHNSFRGHQTYTEPDASSLNPRSSYQIINRRARNHVPGLSYEAVPQQPVYIFTNFTDCTPKNSVTKTVRLKSVLRGKLENSSSKKKSVRFAKRNSRTIYNSDDDTEIIDHPSTKTEASYDETY